MPPRPTRPDEWPRLRELRLRALRTDPDAFGARLEDEEAMPESAWRERATPGDGRSTFVAEGLGGSHLAPSGGPHLSPAPMWAGLATGLLKEPHRAELAGMWVAPEARGRGVGRAVVEAVVAWARERGATRVTLWVNAANAPAIALYERCGFARAGEPQQGTLHPERRYQKMERVP